MSGVPTYGERRKKGKKANAHRASHHQRKSRKAKYVAKRKPVRDSTGVVRHASAMQTFTLAQYRARVTVAAAHKPAQVIDLVSSDDEGEENARNTKQHGDEEKEEDAAGHAVIDLVSSDSDDSSQSDDGRWPDGSMRQTSYDNFEHIQFKDTGSMDPCACTTACTPYSGCINVESEIYCTSRNCGIQNNCGNRDCDFDGLEIRRGVNGFSVFATRKIREGHVIGPYWGELTTHDFDAEEELSSEYAMELQTASDDGQKIYVDAAPGGGITRFINHSCEPNSYFFERRYRRQLRVLVVATTDILAGEEITVHYSDELWFTCNCGSTACQSKE